MAAGFAMEGYVPYVNTIATFITRRCYEQVAVDLCLHNLPVRLIGNGGGLVYAPLRNISEFVSCAGRRGSASAIASPVLWRFPERTCHELR
jgi:hypothetical protein